MFYLLGRVSGNIFEIFLSSWACVIIFLCIFVLTFVFLNLPMIFIIKNAVGYKSYFYRQPFIKKILLLNNPNYPNKAYVVLTWIHYAFLILLLIAIICHIVLQLQVTSIIVQCISIICMYDLFFLWLILILKLK